MMTALSQLVRMKRRLVICFFIAMIAGVEPYLTWPFRESGPSVKTCDAGPLRAISDEISLAHVAQVVISANVKEYETAV